MRVDVKKAIANVSGGPGSSAWGDITGTLANQTDLQSAIDAKSGTSHNHTGVYEPADATILKDADIGVTVAAALGANDNYVTDAQLTVIGNTSGTNTGDNATNTQYSGLAASKQDTLVSGTSIKTINSTSLLGAGDIVTATVSDTAYGVGWDGDTTTAPSKNAVYDKIQTMGGGVSLADVYPVGSVYISVVSTSPATLFGMGTWSAFGAGKVLVGLDSGDTDFDVVEETGGAKTVAAAGTNAAEAAHTHTYTEVPNHVHVLNGFPTTTGGSTGFTRDTSMSGTPANTGLSTNNPTGGVATGTTAAGSSHNHTFTGSATSVVQPYIVVYMWKRTA